MPKHHNPLEIPLPDIRIFQAITKNGTIGHRRIPHRQILKLLSETEGSGDLIQIYRNKVMPVKTRTIHLLGRKGPAKIMYTLFGFEVQASYKRIQCPDLVTARYLKLFSELGCRTIRLPYDPTVTASIITDLETALERVGSVVRELFPKPKEVQLYVLRRLYRLIRQQLAH